MNRWCQGHGTKVIGYEWGRLYCSFFNVWGMGAWLRRSPAHFLGRDSGGTRPAVR